MKAVLLLSIFSFLVACTQNPFHGDKRVHDTGTVNATDPAAKTDEANQMKHTPLTDPN